MKFDKDPILVVGDERTAFSIAVCFLAAGHPVILNTNQELAASTAIDQHLYDLSQQRTHLPERENLTITNTVDESLRASLAVIITPEDLELKRVMLSKVEKLLSDEALITINTESFTLTDVTRDAASPDRIIGANWTEPAHTTFFLEVIVNGSTRKALVNDFVAAAKDLWQKDPYVLNNDKGIRSRMISAMVREAFYLLENGYVSAEDVDRACRNDPGYYLPFAGHCRYMDLMGTYIYGLVMKDLNPELSKDTHIPAFFSELVNGGADGMKTGKGIYSYEGKEIEHRLVEFRKFSYEIQHLIEKYPFRYPREGVARKTKVVSDI